MACASCGRTTPRPRWRADLTVALTHISDMTPDTARRRMPLTARMSPRPVPSKPSSAVLRITVCPGPASRQSAQPSVPGSSARQAGRRSARRMMGAPGSGLPGQGRSVAAASRPAALGTASGPVTNAACRSTRSRQFTGAVVTAASCQPDSQAATWARTRLPVQCSCCRSACARGTSGLANRRVWWDRDPGSALSRRALPRACRAWWSRWNLAECGQT